MKAFLCTLALILLFAHTGTAQNASRNSRSSNNSYSHTPRDRSYIKRKIQEWGSCRNVAITSSQGDLALNENNAWAGTALPKDLTDRLNKLNREGKFIDDVQLTESGRWLVLFENNGFAWNYIPPALERKLREFNKAKEVVTSATFNDKGDWILISTEHVSASHSRIQEYLREGIESFGQLWAAHLTNDGLVLCFERGYKFLGNVPEALKQALDNSNLDVYRIKFTAGGAYFFADKYGNYDALM